MKKKGEQIREKKKIPGSWRFSMWGACQSVLAQSGLMEFNLNPLSGKTGCSNSLWSSCIVKCLMILMTARLILKDWVYETLMTSASYSWYPNTAVNFYLDARFSLTPTDVLHYALRCDHNQSPCWKSGIRLAPILSQVTLGMCFVLSGPQMSSSVKWR